MRASLLTILLCLPLLAPATSLANPDPTNSIVRVRAIAPDGTLKLGSGVVIAPDRVATACHVTRRASTIQIVHGAQRWTARAQTGSVARDVCVLSVAPARFDVPVASLRDSADLVAGERVVAASFPGGTRRAIVSDGVITGLYAYDGGQVIRTTATFDHGSSGGGLFDESGRLVGLLAFRSGDDVDLRFAVPSEWIAGAVPEVDFPLDPTVPAVAFWERTLLDRPSFLGIALGRDHTGASRDGRQTAQAGTR